MIKYKLKLDIAEVEAIVNYLSEVDNLVHHPDAPRMSVTLRIVILNVGRVFDKLRAKMQEGVGISTKLAEEHALALQLIMSHYPCPHNWTYTANVIRITQAQLPPLLTPNVYQAGLRSGRHMPQLLSYEK